MIINVTQAHIDRGREGDCRLCPIALAIHDATGDWGYSVSRRYVLKMSHIENKSWVLPEKARDFILHFDMGVFVQPFSFEIDLPESVR